MHTEPLTYAQIEHLLTKLGYREVPSQPEARVFVNTEYDAVSVLPCADANEPARPHHLITLQKIAIEKGIVEPDTFEEILREVLQKPVESLAKAS